MSKLWTLATVLHSYQYAALDRDRIDSDGAEHAVKTGVLKMLVGPFAGVAALPLFLFGESLGSDGAEVLVVVILFTLVFGVSAYTDRVYNRNLANIEVLTRQILDDPNRGRSWARRKIAAIVLVELVALFVFAGLGRFYVIFGTDQPFIAL